MCLKHWETEKNPRQGSPVSAWMGRAMEKDWPKKPSDCQLQELKKDTDRAMTPVVEPVHVPAHLMLPESLQVPNMEKETVNQIQEARRVPSRRNPRRNTPRHILIKLTKTKHKERILKAAREKQQVTYKGNPIGLTVDLSGEILQARREWQDISKVLKGENMQPRLLYPERFSFKIDGEIKSFSDKQKLREFSTSKPALQQMLKGLIQSRNTREEKRAIKSIPNN